MQHRYIIKKSANLFYKAENDNELNLKNVVNLSEILEYIETPLQVNSTYSNNNIIIIYYYYYYY